MRDATGEAMEKEFLSRYLRLRADRGGPNGGLPSLRRLRLDYAAYLRSLACAGTGCSDSEESSSPNPSSASAA